MNISTVSRHVDADGGELLSFHLVNLADARGRDGLGTREVVRRWEGEDVLAALHRFPEASPELLVRSRERRCLSLENNLHARRPRLDRFSVDLRTQLLEGLHHLRAPFEPTERYRFQRVDRRWTPSIERELR
ncbi:MAG: hypothetical protein DMF56_13855 [Acidobacteria bacterium]|nr:MAG: hypothetical protein DMF56_13855 [Acidobacteriota bacterium]